MRILHICNDYSGSKVHCNLYKSLDALLDGQTVYAYYDSSEVTSGNQIETEHSHVIYDDIQNRYMRKVYPLNRWWVFHSLVKKIDVRNFDCIHATTLFSDGGIAYKLHKKYKIPYVVAVRATDIKYIQRNPKLLMKTAKDILLHASKIIFINRVSYDNVADYVRTVGIWKLVKDKFLIRPNGIDEYWLRNIYSEKRSNTHTVCYMGNFYVRKNVVRLIKAIEMLKASYPDIVLHIVGDGGPDETIVYDMAENDSAIHLHGRISDKETIRDILRQNAIFAMPSIGETFGLVYVEALSQGLRLIYSKNEGIDGLFYKVGEAVDPKSVESIARGICTIIDHYDDYNDNIEVGFSQFDWRNIAREYLGIYESAVENEKQKIKENKTQAIMNKRITPPRGENN